MIWQARGKDASGADTHIASGVSGGWLIVSHKASGVDLYAVAGNVKTLRSIGFRSVEAAKDYVERL